MNEANQNKKRFINLIKKIKNGVFSMNVENALQGLRKPKMVMTLVQPAPADANENYRSARFFIGVEDIIKITEALMKIKPTSEQPTMLFQGYQGGFNENKKRNCIEARVLRITTKLYNKQGQMIPSYTFMIENCEGEQKTISNGTGQQVAGTVSPAKGGKVFAKNSFGATREEAVYIATMMRIELQAWRNAVNTEMLFYPDRYRFHYDNQQGKAQSQPPAVNADKYLTAGSDVA